MYGEEESVKEESDITTAGAELEILSFVEGSEVCETHHPLVSVPEEEELVSVVPEEELEKVCDSSHHPAPSALHGSSRRRGEVVEADQPPGYLSPRPDVFGTGGRTVPVKTSTSTGEPAVSSPEQKDLSGNLSLLSEHSRKIQRMFRPIPDLSNLVRLVEGSGVVEFSSKRKSLREKLDPDEKTGSEKTTSEDIIDALLAGFPHKIVEETHEELCNKLWEHVPPSCSPSGARLDLDVASAERLAGERKRQEKFERKLQRQLSAGDITEEQLASRRAVKARGEFLRGNNNSNSSVNYSPRGDKNSSNNIRPNIVETNMSSQHGFAAHPQGTAGSASFELLGKGRSMRKCWQVENVISLLLLHELLARCDDASSCAETKNLINSTRDSSSSSTACSTPEEEEEERESRFSQKIKFAPGGVASPTLCETRGGFRGWFGESGAGAGRVLAGRGGGRGGSERVESRPSAEEG